MKIIPYIPAFIALIGLGSYDIWLFASERQSDAVGVLVYVVMLLLFLCSFHLICGLMDRVRSIEDRLLRYEMREIEIIMKKPKTYDC